MMIIVVKARYMFWKRGMCAMFTMMTVIHTGLMCQIHSWEGHVCHITHDVDVEHSFDTYPNISFAIS